MASTPSPEPPAVPSPAQVDKRGQAVLVWAAGALCIYGWDWILCLPLEYHGVWKKKFTLISIIYLVNRYFGFIQFAIVVSLMADAWSPAVCKYMFYWDPIGFLISTVLSQMILGIRVYAIYSQSRVVAILLSLILVVEVCLGGITISLTSSPAGPNPSCIAVPAPRGWMIEYCLVPLFYDTVSFGLTAWKTYDFWKKEVINTPLISIIWKDGILYFFAICTMNSVNVLIFLIAPNSITWVVNLTPTLIFTVILSCRLVLNLRNTQANADTSLHSSGRLLSSRNRNALMQNHVALTPDLVPPPKSEWVRLSVPSPVKSDLGSKSHHLSQIV